LNYFYDFGGTFKGLAFGNFKTAEEAAQVILTFQDYEFGGRKIKVEYKKKLPGGGRIFFLLLLLLSFSFQLNPKKKNTDKKDDHEGMELSPEQEQDVEYKEFYRELFAFKEYFFFSVENYCF